MGGEVSVRGGAGGRERYKAKGRKGKKEGHIQVDMTHSHPHRHSLGSSIFDQLEAMQHETAGIQKRAEKVR